MKGRIINPILPTPETGASGNAGVNFVQRAVPAAINLAFVIGVIIFFFTLIIGAIQWISSGGDKQALESAKGRITNALIGIVLLFSAYALIKFIGSFFGLDLLILDIGALKI